MLRISAKGMQPIELDGLIAKMVLALCMKRREILSAPSCQVMFDCPAGTRGIKLRVSPLWIESELGLPAEQAS